MAAPMDKVSNNNNKRSANTEDDGDNEPSPKRIRPPGPPVTDMTGRPGNNPSPTNWRLRGHYPHPFDPELDHGTSESTARAGQSGGHQSESKLLQEALDERIARRLQARFNEEQTEIQLLDRTRAQIEDASLCDVFGRFMSEYELDAVLHFIGYALDRRLNHMNDSARARYRELLEQTGPQLLSTAVRKMLREVERSRESHEFDRRLLSQGLRFVRDLVQQEYMLGGDRHHRDRHHRHGFPQPQLASDEDLELERVRQVAAVAELREAIREAINSGVLVPSKVPLLQPILDCLESLTEPDRGPQSAELPPKAIRLKFLRRKIDSGDLSGVLPPELLQGVIRVVERTTRLDEARSSKPAVTAASATPNGGEKTQLSERPSLNLVEAKMRRSIRAAKSKAAAKAESKTSKAESKAARAESKAARAAERRASRLLARQQRVQPGPSRLRAVKSAESLSSDSCDSSSASPKAKKPGHPDPDMKTPEEFPGNGLPVDEDDDDSDAGDSDCHSDSSSSSSDDDAPALSDHDDDHDTFQDASSRSPWDQWATAVPAATLHAPSDFKLGGGGGVGGGPAAYAPPPAPPLPDYVPGHNYASALPPAPASPRPRPLSPPPLLPLPPEESGVVDGPSAVRDDGATMSPPPRPWTGRNGGALSVGALGPVREQIRVIRPDGERGYIAPVSVIDSPTNMQEMLRRIAEHRARREADRVRQEAERVKREPS